MELVPPTFDEAFPEATVRQFVASAHFDNFDLEAWSLLRDSSSANLNDGHAATRGLGSTLPVALELLFRLNLHNRFAHRFSLPLRIHYRLVHICLAGAPCSV